MLFLRNVSGTLNCIAISEIRFETLTFIFFHSDIVMLFCHASDYLRYWKCLKSPFQAWLIRVQNSDKWHNLALMSNLLTDSVFFWFSHTYTQTISCRIRKMCWVVDPAQKQKTIPFTNLRFIPRGTPGTSFMTNLQVTCVAQQRNPKTCLGQPSIIYFRILTEWTLDTTQTQPSYPRPIGY